MDHELMTMWLSVDPLADKYPSLSPYAYCAWNPVKLVDPDGRMIDDYFSLNGEYLVGSGQYPIPTVFQVFNCISFTVLLEM